ncbi:hypothetical protein MKEN_01050500 [Mycena kentingensis (nom. inval.)]|nr:hypothetical protein MKEN_01050500 [Mycena kentingensis (nom. inval.)]
MLVTSSHLAWHRPALRPQSISPRRIAPSHSRCTPVALPLQWSVCLVDAHAVRVALIYGPSIVVETRIPACPPRAANVLPERCLPSGMNAWSTGMLPPPPSSCRYCRSWTGLQTVAQCTPVAGPRIQQPYLPCTSKFIIA